MKTIDKEGLTYKEMTIMRGGFNGDGRIPNLFEPEKKCVNNIMDIFDEHSVITEQKIDPIKHEIDIVESTQHYNGVAWYDFLLHLNQLLLQINYQLVLGKEHKVVSIKKKK